jgi:hypothetical protein
MLSEPTRTERAVLVALIGMHDGSADAGKAVILGPQRA